MKWAELSPDVRDSYRQRAEVLRKRKDEDLSDDEKESLRDALVDQITSCVSSFYSKLNHFL